MKLISLLTLALAFFVYYNCSNIVCLNVQIEHFFITFCIILIMLLHPDSHVPCPTPLKQRSIHFLLISPTLILKEGMLLEEK